MKKLKVAFATDDGKTFMDRHFGDAEYYYIYEMIKLKCLLLKKKQIFLSIRSVYQFLYFYYKL